MTKKKKRQIQTWTRAGIQILFSLFLPSAYSGAFAGLKGFILEARNGPKIGLDPFCCIALCPVWIRNSVLPLLLRLCMCVRQSRRLDFCSPQSYCEEAKKADETYAEGACPRSDLYEICGTLRHRAALLLGHIHQNPRNEPLGGLFTAPCAAFFTGRLHDRIGALAFDHGRNVF